MMNLFRLEFRRLIRAKSFYICTVIALVMILISAATNKLVLNMAASEEMPEAFSAMIQAPTALSMLKTTVSSSFTMVLAIFLSIFVTEDYAGDIIKNFYAKGNSRDSVFVSKYVAAITASVVMVVVCGLFSFAAGKVLFGEYGTAGNNYVGSLLVQFLILLSYATLYFAIAISIKKTGASIAISIIGPLVVSLLLSLGNAAIKSEEINLTEYWIDGRLAILQQANVAWTDVWVGIIVGGVVLLIAGISAFFINNNSEQ